VTPAQYLDFERAAETNHEYVHGEVVELVRPALPHAVVVGNLSFQFGRHSLGPVFTNNLRVSVQRGKLMTYPDLVLVEGDPHWLDDDRDTLTNPGFIVEVLSPPARDYARATSRGRLYRSSISEYLVIDSKPVFVEHWRKLSNGNWELATIVDRDATLHLESLNCEIPVPEIYDEVERYA
jgi:Uma2 family endonuclease